MLVPHTPAEADVPLTCCIGESALGTLSAVFTSLSGLHAGHSRRAGHRVEDILWRLMSKTFGSRGLGAATLPLR